MPGEVKRETLSEIIWTSSTGHQLLVSLDQTSSSLSTFLKWKNKKFACNVSVKNRYVKLHEEVFTAI